MSDSTPRPGAIGVPADTRLKRILLFSDGLANEGETSLNALLRRAEAMLRRGVTICTFGIGEDFDEELMKGLAKHGAGDYYFIERADQIEGFVHHTLDGLKGLFGVNAKLKLRGLNGATITKIYAYATEELINGISLHDLRQGFCKTALIQVSIPAPSSTPSSSSSSMDYLSWELTYDRIQLNKDGGYIKQLSVEQGKLSIQLVDENKDMGPKNKEVVAMASLEETLALEASVQESLRRGDREAAKKIRRQMMKQHADNDRSFGSVATAERRTAKQLSLLDDDQVSMKTHLLQSQFYIGARTDTFHDDL